MPVSPEGGQGDFAPNNEKERLVENLPLIVSGYRQVFDPDGSGCLAAGARHRAPRV